MRALAATLILYGSALAAVLAAMAVAGRERGQRSVAALVLVQVATMLWVVVDVVRSIGGRTAGSGGQELAVHLAYLATAVIVLPVSFTVAGADSRRWGHAAMSVACLLLVVVLIRAQQTAVLDG